MERIPIVVLEQKKIRECIKNMPGISSLSYFVRFLAGENMYFKLEVTKFDWF